MSQDKIKIGQKVWLVGIKSYKPGVIEAEVINIGRKYFTVKADWREEQIDLNELHSKPPKGYGPDFKCYLNIQEYYDQQEFNKKANELYSAFSWSSSKIHGKITLEEIRQIHQIVFKTNNG